MKEKNSGAAHPDSNIIFLGREPRFVAKEIYLAVKRLSDAAAKGERLDPGNVRFAAAEKALRAAAAGHDFRDYAHELDAEIMRKRSELHKETVAAAGLAYASDANDPLAPIGIMLVRRFSEESRDDLNPIIFSYLRPCPIERAAFLEYMCYSEIWAGRTLALFGGVMPPSGLSGSRASGDDAEPLSPENQDSAGVKSPEVAFAGKRLIAFLEYYPGLGADYVMAGLLSGDASLQRAAAHSLSKWKTITGAELERFAPELMDAVRELLSRKLDDELRYVLIDLFDTYTPPVL